MNKLYRSLASLLLVFTVIGGAVGVPSAEAAVGSVKIAPATESGSTNIPAGAVKAELASFVVTNYSSDNINFDKISFNLRKDVENSINIQNLGNFILENATYNEEVDTSVVEGNKVTFESNFHIEPFKKVTLKLFSDVAKHPKTGEKISFYINTDEVFVYDEENERLPVNSNGNPSIIYSETKEIVKTQLKVSSPVYTQEIREIPKGSTKVEFLQVNFSSYINEDILLKKIVFTKNGSGETAFKGMEKLSIFRVENGKKVFFAEGKKINESDSKVVFSDLNVIIKPNQTLAMKLQGDVADNAKVGESFHFTVETFKDIYVEDQSGNPIYSYNFTKPVGPTFEITEDAFSKASVLLDESNPEEKNVMPGEKDEFLAFNIGATCQTDLKLRKIQINKKGTLPYETISGIALYDVENNKYYSPVSISGNIIKFEPNLLLEKCKTKLFNIVAKVDAEAQEGKTLGFDIPYTQDEIIITGSANNYPVKIEGTFPIVGNLMMVSKEIKKPDLVIKDLLFEGSKYYPKYSTEKDNINYYISDDEIDESSEEYKEVYKNTEEDKKDPKYIRSLVCNIGDADLVKTDVTVKYKLEEKEKSHTWKNLNLKKDECKKDFSIQPQDLGITETGYYTILAKVDPENKVTEKNEENNIIKEKLKIEVYEEDEDDEDNDNYHKKVDLKIKDLLFKKSYDKKDPKQEIIAVVCNLGKKDMEKTDVALKYAFDKKEKTITWKSFELKKDECKEGFKIEPKELGIKQSGYYNIWTKIDSEDKVDEVNEMNNHYSEKLYINLKSDKYDDDKKDDKNDKDDKYDDDKKDDKNDKDDKYDDDKKDDKNDKDDKYDDDKKDDKNDKDDKYDDDKKDDKDDKDDKYDDDKKDDKNDKDDKYDDDKKDDKNDKDDKYDDEDKYDDDKDDKYDDPYDDEDKYDDYDKKDTVPPAGYEEKVITALKNPFPDTDLNTLLGQAAAELYRRAIVGGFPDGEFKGDRMVNRAEAAKFLLRSKYENISDYKNNGIFPDVLEGEWYVKYVVYAAKLGIIKGYPDKMFRPEKNVITVEFLKMLTLTFKLEKNLDHDYKDVDEDEWYAQYVGIAKKYDLFPNRKNNLYPEKALTRSEVAIAIYQYLKNR